MISRVLDIGSTVYGLRNFESLEEQNPVSVFFMDQLGMVEGLVLRSVFFFIVVTFILVIANIFLRFMIRIDLVKAGWLTWGLLSMLAFVNNLYWILLVSG